MLNPDIAVIHIGSNDTSSRKLDDVNIAME